MQILKKGCALFTKLPPISFQWVFSSHFVVTFVQHVPRINRSIPTYEDASADHQRLLDRWQTFLPFVINRIEGIDCSCAWNFFQVLSLLDNHKVVSRFLHILSPDWCFWKGDLQLPMVFFHMVLFRLEMYGLAEQKIKGDGNCQVFFLLLFKAPLWGFVSIHWTEIWHLFLKRIFLSEEVTWGEDINVVKKSLSAVIHMLKADCESLIKVDMS